MNQPFPPVAPPIVLNEAQAKALATIVRCALYRVTGGWRARGTPLVRLETASVLTRAKLAQVVIHQHQKLISTPEGKAYAEQLQARRKQA